MKTSRIVKLMGVVLISMLLTVQVEAADRKVRGAEKNAISLTVDKPIIEFLARAYSEQLSAADIIRVQRMLDQVDHITITFRDKDASDYVLHFKALDKKGLEDWMFSEGYLKSNSEPDAEVASIEPWMLDPNYLD
ncbi:MAG: hypothetical protein WC699_15795 [Bacteroidales bacterium]|jgi:hypothetical protein